MKFKEKNVKYLNTLLKRVKNNREAFIETLKIVCPKDGECDTELEESREAINCEYFTLCNVMGSYSLMNEEDREHADLILDQLYKKIESSKKIKNIYV